MIDAAEGLSAGQHFQNGCLASSFVTHRHTPSSWLEMIAGVFVVSDSKKLLT